MVRAVRAAMVFQNFADGIVSAAGREASGALIPAALQQAVEEKWTISDRRPTEWYV